MTLAESDHAVNWPQLRMRRHLTDMCFCCAIKMVTAGEAREPCVIRDRCYGGG